MKVLLFAALFAAAAAADVYSAKYEYPAQEAHSYAWEVKDAESYNHFGQNHKNDGKQTTGSYHVLLPDGRTQTVYYTSDSVRGYEVDVKYNGYAKEDSYYKPAYKPVVYTTTTTTTTPAPTTTTYKPTAPVYKTYRQQKVYPSWFFNTNKKY